MNRIRRNVVTRLDSAIAIAAGAAAGITARAGDVSPTAAPVTDTIVLAGLGALVCWLAASSPWWVAGVVGAVAAIVAPGWWALPAVAAVVLSAVLGVTRSGSGAVRAVAAALAMVAFAGATFEPFTGASTALAVAGGLALAISGWWRRPRAVRRRVLVGAGIASVACVLATVGLAVAAAQSRSDLTGGYDDLRDGLDLLRDGDTVAAADTLDRAATQLSSGIDTLGAAWAQPARLVPVAAQHRHAAVTVVADAAITAQEAADALRSVDLDALTVVNGAVDLLALEALQQPLAELDDAVARLDASLADADSPWLLGPVQTRLDDAAEQADDAGRQAALTRRLAELGPAMLGGDGQRRYFLAFTSPGEARGQSGLMGNWAVLRVREGVLSVERTGRSNELDTAFERRPAPLDMPAEFFDRYARFGSGTADTPPPGKFWSNITMSPDTPSVAQAMSQMYEQATGQNVDGVLVVDPVALAALLDLTGPVTVAGWPEPISSANALDVLLREQYTLDEQPRETFLQALVDGVVDALLGTTLPPPQQMARTLGPPAQQGHLSAWMMTDDEQAFVSAAGMGAELPALDGADGLAVVTNNASGNKIDSFLSQTVRYDARADSITGRVQSEVTIELTNNAPTSGLPDYVIGNLVNAPIGTNRTLLSVYTPLQATAITIDGEARGVSTGTELGWNVIDLPIDVAAGSTTTVTLQLEGTVQPGDYRFVWRPQPLVSPPTLTLQASQDGRTVLAVSEVEPRRRQFSAADAVPVEQR